MDHRNIKLLGIIAIFVIVTIAVAGCTQSSPTVTPAATPTPTPTPVPGMKYITDMSGHTLTVPTNITKVLTTHNPINDLLIMLKPDVLYAGINLSGTKYIHSTYAYSNHSQPGSTEQGVPNYEQFLAYNPDVILYDYYVGGNTEDAYNNFRDHVNPVPLIAINNAVDATNYTPEIRFVGDLLGAQDKANQLIDFYTRVYSTVNKTVATIPDSQKKRVYYAEGPQGLQTDGPDSFHSSLITIAGGINVGDVPFKGGSGMASVNLEQVIKWNPDVIIANNQQFYNTVYNNSTWSNIKAVKDHQVYLTPSQPFNWLDRPPGENRIIGIPWTAKVLYPDLFKDVDMKSLTKEFYSKFYNYDLTDTEVNTILNSSGLKSS